MKCVSFGTNVLAYYIEQCANYLPLRLSRMFAVNGFSEALQGALAAVKNALKLRLKVDLIKGPSIPQMRGAPLLLA